MEIDVAVYSIFRDNEGDYIDKYFERLKKLKWDLGNIIIFAGEGDSEDATGNQLAMYEEHDDQLEIHMIKCDTGRKRMYHTPDPYRMQTRAITGNAVYDAISKHGKAMYVLHLESDLEYNEFLIANLHNTLIEYPDAGCVSPMVWVKENGIFRFYDQWAFRTLSGKMFPPLSTIWYRKHRPNKPYKIQSSGSCVLFDANLLYVHSDIRLTYDEEIRGMTKKVREHGYDVLVDPNIAIVHPEGDYRT